MFKRYFGDLPITWWIKVTLILIAFVFSVLYAVPTFLGDPKEWPMVDKSGKPIATEAITEENKPNLEYQHWYHKVASKVFPNKRVSLGLDLRGGLHLILEVDSDQSVRDAIMRSFIRARDNVAKDGVVMTDLEVLKDFHAQAHLGDVSKVDAAKQAVQRQSSLLTFEKLEGNKIIFAARKDRIDEERTKVLTQAVNIVRNRIDQFNVAEPNIFQQGDSRIVVQLPGMKEPERAKELIGNTAKLDFRVVLNDVTAEKLPDLISEARKAENLPEGDIKPETIAKISAWLQDQNKIPRSSVIVLERQYSDEAGDGKMKFKDARPLLVEANPRLTGDEVENATADTNAGSLIPQWGVSLQFKPQGAKLFGDLTTEAFKKEKSTGQIAIVLDGNVHSAPNVNEPILGGSARITMGGRRGDEAQRIEAEDLALVLRAGALPATVRIIEERQVGPSEGEENIRAGVFSSTLATSLIILFMIYIYGNSGIIANLAMLFNVAIILGFLAAFGATLTLPGIAGITLTLAIAVDGNVIINERIREELLLGLSPKQAFYKGYDLSFLTLVDSHLTAAFAGIILLVYGNPAVRGFAVTLLVGITATLFTAYFVTEVIGQWLIEKTKIKRFA